MPRATKVGVGSIPTPKEALGPIPNPTPTCRLGHASAQACLGTGQGYGAAAKCTLCGRGGRL